jgi:surface polysaccharide O-acyltransferase-like enzyme
MKIAYFVCANAWALGALALFLGGTAVRDSPTYVALFGAGAWIEQGQYRLINVVILAAAVVFSILWIREPRSARVSDGA